jgi:hypothetical protein
MRVDKKGNPSSSKSSDAADLQDVSCRAVALFSVLQKEVTLLP